MCIDIGDAIGSAILESVAHYLRPVSHADCVMQVPPVWVRASGAEALFGIKRDFLNGLVAKRMVTAKKADKIVLYKYSDIEKAIDSMDNFKKGKK